MIPLILASTASAYLILAIIIFGRRKDSYSHIRFTISELGEYGSRDQKIVAFGVFLPVSLAVAGVACFIPSSNPFQIGLALCIATGYFVASFFPCDVGSPYTGTTRQGIHNLGGGIEYAGGAMCLFGLSEPIHYTFGIVGVSVILGMLFVSFENPIRGLVQRCTETILFGSLLYSLWPI